MLNEYNCNAFYIYTNLYINVQHHASLLYCVDVRGRNFAYICIVSNV